MNRTIHPLSFLKFNGNWLLVILPFYGTMLHTSKVLYCGFWEVETESELVESEWNNSTILDYEEYEWINGTNFESEWPEWENGTNMDTPRDNLTIALVALL